MRLRDRRRIEKRSRIAAHTTPFRWKQLDGAGPEELLQIALDPTLSWYLRADAAKILAAKQTPMPLLHLFFQQEEKVALWETGLVLETAGRGDAIGPLIQALLHDENPHRRHAAARALGWNGNHPARCAKALVAALTDLTQPQPVREEACESLAYLNWRQATPALAAAVEESDVRIRFWATFGLGGMHHRKSWRHDPRAVAALESILEDAEVAPGNWWSVGLEALDMLSSVYPPLTKYRTLATQRSEAIRSDPKATPEEHRWASR